MIMLVTDRRRLSPGATEIEAADRVVQQVEAASQAGIDLIQIRERDLSARDLAALVRRCVAAVEGTKARVLVNDRLDVALATGAHGVNLREDSLETGAVRSLLPAGGLLGRSFHNGGEASAASEQGCLDYLILGTLFQTTSKSGPTCLTSIRELTAVCKASLIPVLAIGGMTVERARAVAKAGAEGIAAIGLFIPPSGEPVRDYLPSVTADIRRAFDTCGAVP